MGGLTFFAGAAFAAAGALVAGAALAGALLPALILAQRAFPMAESLALAAADMPEGLAAGFGVGGVDPNRAESWLWSLVICSLS